MICNNKVILKTITYHFKDSDNGCIMAEALEDLVKKKKKSDVGVCWPLLCVLHDGGDKLAL